MTDKKQRAPRHITPVGFAAPFAKLVTPDEYKGQRKFKVSLILTRDGADAILKTTAYEEAVDAARREYEAAQADAKKKGKKLPPFTENEPFSVEVDKDSGDETGNLVFKFSTNAEFEDKKTGKIRKRAVPFFTAGNKPISEEEKPEVWGGSRIRVSYSLFPYVNAAAKAYGVSLRLEAVKIIELRTGGSGADGSGYGFEEEDGYEGEAGGSADTDGGSSDEEDAPAF